MVPFDQIVKRVEQIPALSPAAVHAMALLENPSSDADRVERIIRLDPALTAKFLRIANSASFGLPGGIDSLRDAIVRLGWKRVRDIVLVAALSAVIPPEIPGYGMDATEFSNHCAAVALLTERLYAARGETPPSAAFAAALLHDIGRLALGSLIEDTVDDLDALVAGREDALEGLERELFGTDHAEIGGRLARAWRLPDALACACAHHHAPEEAPEQHHELIELIRVADLIAYGMGYGAELGGRRPAVEASMTDAMGIGPDALDAVRTEIEAFGGLLAS